MPLAIPGVISGLAFFLLFIGTPLYGTLILLVLAFMSRFLAYGTRLMHSAQVQIHTELEEAAVTAGVPYLRTFLSINLRRTEVDRPRDRGRALRQLKERELC